MTRSSTDGPVAVRRSKGGTAAVAPAKGVVGPGPGATFALIYGAYVGMLLVRKNYGFWLPLAMDVLGREKKDVAVIGSSYEMLAGAGALLNGALIDAIEPAFGLAGALVLSALVNLCLCGVRSLPVMAALWGCNGLVQSLGWPCVSKVFLRAFPDPMGRGMWYSILSTSQNVGAALVPLIVTRAVASTGDRRASFFVPATTSLVLGVVLLHALALPAYRAMRTRPEAAAAGPKAPVAASPPRSGASLVSSVLMNWSLWAMAACYFCIGVIRSCLADWTPIFLAEEKGMGMEVASRCLCAFEFGGFLGSVLAGRASDSVFAGRRGPVMCICTTLLCPALFALSAFRSQLSLLTCYFCLGALAFPVHVLLGLASREVVAPEASSTAGGLVKFVAQLGASSAGYPLGLFQRSHGWSAVLSLLASIACAGGALAATLWWTVARVDETPAQKRARARRDDSRHKQKGG